MFICHILAKQKFHKTAVMYKNTIIPNNNNFTKIANLLISYNTEIIIIYNIK